MVSFRLMNLFESYESCCAVFYKQTVDDLRSIAILKKLLQRLHPEKDYSILQSITRTFTV